MEMVYDKLKNREKEKDKRKIEGWIESKEVREAKDKYGEVANYVNNKYEKAVELDSSKRAGLEGLKKHNDIVLHYAMQLVEAKKESGLGKFSENDTMASLIGAMTHDMDKLDSHVLGHHMHERGSAEEFMAEFLGKELNGQEMKKDIIEKILKTGERHQNHPFLVAWLNGEIKKALEKDGTEDGKKGIIKEYKKKYGIEEYLYGGKDSDAETIYMFPMPENDIDRIVYSSDMLANSGFKNMLNRLRSAVNIEDDKKVAQEKGKTLLWAIAKNVVSGVENLKKDIEDLEKKTGKQLLTEKAREMLDKHAQNVKLIFEDLERNGVFQAIHNEFDKLVLGKAVRGKSAEIDPKNSEHVLFFTEKLNEAIMKAGERLIGAKLVHSGKIGEFRKAREEGDREKLKEMKEELGLMDGIDLQHYQM